MVSIKSSPLFIFQNCCLILLLDADSQMLMPKSLEQVSKEAGSEDNFVPETVGTFLFPTQWSQRWFPGLRWWHHPGPACIVPCDNKSIPARLAQVEVWLWLLFIASLGSCPFPLSDSPSSLAILWITQHPFNKIFSVETSQSWFLFLATSTLSKPGDWLDSQTIIVPFSGWCWMLP